jgi:hypothetical protein
MSYDKNYRFRKNTDLYTHEYLKLLKQVAQKRMQLMMDIMNSRNVQYDPEHIVKQETAGQAPEP